ncbi:MAG TPA: hypothetical protein VFE07_03720 [Marmoricola sp.]|nr:hypothetical protein [Marmoricola sp.]
MHVDDSFTATRRSLHGVAELLLAGPQHAACGKITLRTVAGGFGTTHTPDLRVEGGSLVAGDRRADIDARTPRDLGEELGIVPRTLDDVYSDGSGVGLDDRLEVRAADAARLAAAFAVGDAALRAVAPDITPVLWPEHFDIGISVGEVNYGVSPGDTTIRGPYMYVGPWQPPPVDDFWNQPFGVARELPESTEDVVAFFEEARTRLS